MIYVIDDDGLHTEDKDGKDIDVDELIRVMMSGNLLGLSLLTTREENKWTKAKPATTY